MVVAIDPFAAPTTSNNQFCKINSVYILLKVISWTYFDNW